MDRDVFVAVGAAVLVPCAECVSDLVDRVTRRARGRQRDLLPSADVTDVRRAPAPGDEVDVVGFVGPLDELDVRVLAPVIDRVDRPLGVVQVRVDRVVDRVVRPKIVRRPRREAHRVMVRQGRAIRQHVQLQRLEGDEVVREENVPLVHVVALDELDQHRHPGEEDLHHFPFFLGEAELAARHLGGEVRVRRLVDRLTVLLQGSVAVDRLLSELARAAREDQGCDGCPAQGVGGVGQSEAMFALVSHLSLLVGKRSSSRCEWASLRWCEGAEERRGRWRLLHVVCQRGLTRFLHVRFQWVRSKFAAGG